jgi:hypothetical protein
VELQHEILNHQSQRCHRTECLSHSPTTWPLRSGWIAYCVGGELWSAGSERAGTDVFKKRADLCMNACPQHQRRVPISTPKIYTNFRNVRQIIRTIFIDVSSRFDTIEAKEINTRSRVKFCPVLCTDQSETYFIEHEQMVNLPIMSSLLFHHWRASSRFLRPEHMPDEPVFSFFDSNE